MSFDDSNLKSTGTFKANLLEHSTVNTLRKVQPLSVLIVCTVFTNVSIATD